MAPPGPKTELRRLLRFVGELETRFLTGHLGTQPLAQPSIAESLDVAAFVVLTHGAFENFVEGLTIWVSEKVNSNWTKRKRVTRSTASLLLRSSWKLEEEENARTVYDVVRIALDEAKAERSRAAVNNNGIGVKHIRVLLSPLGVDLPADPILVASLENLVAMRHEWAHQSRFGARTLRTANEAKRTVDDCLEYAKQLSAQIAALRL